MAKYSVKYASDSTEQADGLCELETKSTTVVNTAHELRVFALFQHPKGCKLTT